MQVHLNISNMFSIQILLNFQKLKTLSFFDIITLMRLQN